MPITSTTRRNSSKGFTLLELLISMALLLVLSGAVLGGMGSLQKNYRGNEIRTALHEQMRSSLELMAQEIGQAGLAPSGMQQNGIYQGSGAASSLATLTPSSAIVAGSTPTINYSGCLQQGTKVLVDTPPNTEDITLTTVTGGSDCDTTGTITATFSLAHSGTSIPVYPHGIYPTGVYFITTPTLTVGNFTQLSMNTSLIMYGDINGSGNLSIVQYSCPTATTATLTDASGVKWGPLTRMEYIYQDGTGTWSATSAAPVHLLEYVRVATTSYPTSADGCRFDYNIYDPAANAKDYMVTSVSITVVAESQRNDPQTNAPVVITKSFMNIQPRNILNAYYLYQTGADLSEVLSTPPRIVTAVSNLGITQ